MSDGPIKLAPPGAPPLDDIILGDDDQTVPTPPVHVRSSVAPMAVDDPSKGKDGATGDERTISRRERSSNRVKTAEPAKDPGKDTRKRQKMTLRIPDDEVSRPQLPASTPMYGVPAVGQSRPSSSPELGPDGGWGSRSSSSPSVSDAGWSSPDLAPAAAHGAPIARPGSNPDPDEAPAMPLHAHRIISVGSIGSSDSSDSRASAEDTLELPRADLETRGASIGERAPGIDATQEAGWTPYQPTVADRAASAAPAAPRAPMRDPAHTMIDEPGMGAMGA